MRPEPFVEALPQLAALPDFTDGRDWLEREARSGLAHPRLSRARNAERAASGRAACRACREVIAKDAWRIALAYYEDGRFVPSGFVHVRCAPAYFETTDLSERLRRLSPGLTDADLAAFETELAAAPPSIAVNPERTSDADPT